VKLLLSPHNDDETLFAAFTILRERPLVCVVFDSHIQVARGATNCDWMTRRMETIEAMKILNPDSAPVFLGIRDDKYGTREIADAIHALGEFEQVYAPAIEEGGHAQHSLVGEIAAKVFTNVRHYMTYTKRGKSEGVPVEFKPEWVVKKLRALASYESQIHHPSNTEHFLRDHREWMQA
jgi:LmbE family N-acetylglucosaminyl deacetylase